MRPRRRAAGEPPAPPAASAWTTALRLLMRRDYTTAELRDRLLDKGFPEADVEDCVSRLTADRTLDDRRVAQSHVRTARDIKGRGGLRIWRELVQRGIAPALAHEIVGAVPGDHDQAQIARILARKRLPARLSLADRRRLFQHLLRRGFPADAISKALRSRGHEDTDESDN
jgi:regulatory protein